MPPAPTPRIPPPTKGLSQVVPWLKSAWPTARPLSSSTIHCCHPIDPRMRAAPPDPVATSLKPTEHELGLIRLLPAEAPEEVATENHAKLGWARHSAHQSESPPTMIV